MPNPAPDVAPQIVSGDLTSSQLEGYLEAGEIAVDTETLGLNHLRDRLCVVQLCDRALRATLVQIPRHDGSPLASRAPRLAQLLEAEHVLKILHFARFDVATLRHHLGIRVAPIYCTRTASKLVRTYTERHGLKDLALELLDVELEKTTTHTDWANANLTPEQVRYAVSDVTLLFDLMDRLNVMLRREERIDLAQACFAVIPTLARLDLMGYQDIFVH